MYQAGTLSSNPLAVAAGLTTLALLERDGVYEKLEENSEIVQTLANRAPGRRIVVQRVGSMLTVFLRTNMKSDAWLDAEKCNTEAFSVWHRILRENGGVLAAESV
ncbi:MAG: hypothetical protein R3A47_11310 [Polyangiales bacterium]